MSEQATPRPWKYYSGSRSIYNPLLPNGQSKETCICVVAGPRESIGRKDANAELIVLAVNAYDEMLAALKAIQAALPDCEDDHLVDAKGNYIAKAVGIGRAAMLVRSAILAAGEGREP